MIQSSYISNTSSISNYKLFIQNDCTQCCHQVIQSSYISNTSSISNYKLFIQNDCTQCCHQVIQSSYISNTSTFLVTSYLFKMIAHNVVIRWYNHHTSVIHPTILHQLQVIYSKWLHTMLSSGDTIIIHQ